MNTDTMDSMLQSTICTTLFVNIAEVCYKLQSSNKQTNKPVRRHMAADILRAEKKHGDIISTLKATTETLRDTHDRKRN